MIKTHLNIPNTSINHDKVRQAVSQFMVEEVLTKEEIMELAMAYLEDSYADLGVGDLAKLVKETDIPKPYTHSPSQPNRILCHGNVEGDYYFYTREDDYEYNTLEVKEEVR
tara:strand:+ start:153 stop:485 length:333 start_codon:yes stop_codon:yes gene_type:complete